MKRLEDENAPIFRAYLPGGEVLEVNGDTAFNLTCTVQPIRFTALSPEPERENLAQILTAMAPENFKSYQVAGSIWKDAQEVTNYKMSSL